MAKTPGMKYGAKDYIVLTNKKVDGKDSIVPIYIETKGNYNYARLDTNKIKSVYNEKGLENKFEQNVEKDNMIKVYDNKKTNIATTVNNAATGNSFNTDNIPQSNTNVKSDISSTRYSMQENENNTQKTENLISKYPNSNLNEDVSNMDGVPAIKLKDGSILPIKSDKTTHVNFIKNNNIDVNDIDSGGWISNGVYEGSYRSDTSRYIEQEKARQRIEAKKKERELDNSSFNLQ